MSTKQIIFAANLLSFILLCASGCQDSDKLQSKREKLQGHSNYQMSLELEQKTQTIAELEKKNQQLQQELEKSQAQATECMTKEGEQFMEIVGPMLDEMNAAKAENEQLKQELKKYTNPE